MFSELINKDLDVINNFFSKMPYFQKAYNYKGRVIAINFDVLGHQVAFDLIPSKEQLLGVNTYNIYVFTRNSNTILWDEQKKSNDKVFLKQCELSELLEGGEIKYRLEAALSKIRNSNTVSLFEKMSSMSKYDIGESDVSDHKVLSTAKKIDVTQIDDNDDFTIVDVIEQDICIGCGACHVATNGKVEVAKTKYGLYKAGIDDVLSLMPSEFKKANLSCPFSSAAANENQLGAPSAQSSQLPWSNEVGQYGTTIAGRVIGDAHLVGSSSGGLTSWFLKQLLLQNSVDSIVHVGQAITETSGLFEYRISDTVAELDQYRKSAYYSTSMHEVLRELKVSGKRYAVVGVPCFIKACRLLSLQDPGVQSSIKFYVGLLCGHLKSSFFAESNAWQLGVAPTDLSNVDFRIKDPSKGANKYRFGAQGKNSNDFVTKPTSELLGANWGHAFFQPNACNYCDDVFAETADVVFGDAWLPQYRKDWRGTNIVVIRNAFIEQVFRKGGEQEEIIIDEISLKDTVRSQAGGLRHRRSGLAVRLHDDVGNDLKVPKKRVSPSLKGIPPWRLDLIRQRRRISSLSLNLFFHAKKTGNFDTFAKPMREEVAFYNYLDSHKYPQVKKKPYYDVALFGWHHQANFGGVLTFFALHEVLRERGLRSVVVWRPKRHRMNVGNKRNYDILSKYYKYTKYRGPEDLHELRRYCSTFAVASDQLWANKWIPFNPEYEFLGCADETINRVSVATSFGGDGVGLPFDGEQKKIVTSLLRKFDHISVREPSGVDILNSVGIDSTKILDPVFLCGQGVYQQLSEQSSIRLKEKKSSYVMGYVLDAEKEVVDFARYNVAESLGVASSAFMTTMPNSDNQLGRLKKWQSFGSGIDFFPDANVADFINAISGSEFVVTDSFHGACLSVIFNKPFICCPKSSRGNSRFALFEQLGLGDRILDRNNLNDCVVKKTIDWAAVNDQIALMRSKSFQWLSSAFGVDFLS